MQRTGPRTGAQNSRSRLNKFKAFIEILANFFDTQSDISKDFDVKQYHFWCFPSKNRTKVLIPKIGWARLIFDPIFAKHSTLTTSIFLNFVEDIVNLFMKLQTSIVTKLVNLDIKLEVI